MKIFLETADRLEADILRGDYVPGSRLPSVRSLAKEMEVSEGTIQNTLRYLRDKRLVVTKRTRGYFVIEDDAYIRQMRKEEGNSRVQNLFSFLHSLGMTDTEIAGLIKKELDCQEPVYLFSSGDVEKMEQER